MTRNLAWVTPNMRGLGGSEYLAVKFAHLMAGRGIKIRFMTKSGMNPVWAGRLARPVQAGQITIHSTPDEDDAAFCEWVLSCCRETSCDIVLWMPLEGPCLTWLDRKPLGIKLMALEPTDLSAACWWLPPELPHLIRKLDGLLVLNPDAATNAVSRFGFSGPLFVVPATIDEGGPTPVGGAGREGVVGCISRLSPEKGLDFALASFALCVGRSPGSRLRIWGDGPDRERLEKLVVMLGIGNCVSFEGLFDGFNQIDQICDSCEVFLLSSWLESCPIALLEMASRGRPVVATATSGARWVLGEDYPWCTPIGDTGSMARSLEILLSDDGERERAGRLLSARFRQVFDPSLAAGMLDGAYSSFAEELERERRP